MRPAGACNLPLDPYVFIGVERNDGTRQAPRIAALETSKGEGWWWDRATDRFYAHLRVGQLYRFYPLHDPFSKQLFGQDPATIDLARTQVRDYLRQAPDDQLPGGRDLWEKLGMQFLGTPIKMYASATNNRRNSFAEIVARGLTDSRGRSYTFCDRELVFMGGDVTPSPNEPPIPPGKVSILSGGSASSSSIWVNTQQSATITPAPYNAQNPRWDQFPMYTFLPLGGRYDQFPVGDTRNTTFKYDIKAHSGNQACGPDRPAWHPAARFDFVRGPGGWSAQVKLDDTKVGHNAMEEAPGDVAEDGNPNYNPDGSYDFRFDTPSAPYYYIARATARFKFGFIDCRWMWSEQKVKRTVGYDDFGRENTPVTFPADGSPTNYEADFKGTVTKETGGQYNTFGYLAIRVLDDKPPHHVHFGTAGSSITGPQRREDRIYGTTGEPLSASGARNAVKVYAADNNPWNIAFGDGIRGRLPDLPPVNQSVAFPATLPTYTPPAQAAMRSSVYYGTYAYAYTLNAQDSSSIDGGRGLNFFPATAITGSLVHKQVNEGAVRLAGVHAFDKNRQPVTPSQAPQQGRPSDSWLSGDNGDPSGSVMEFDVDPSAFDMPMGWHHANRPGADSTSRGRSVYVGDLQSPPREVPTPNAGMTWDDKSRLAAYPFDAHGNTWPQTRSREDAFADLAAGQDFYVSITMAGGLRLNPDPTQTTLQTAALHQAFDTLCRGDRTCRAFMGEYLHVDMEDNDKPEIYLVVTDTKYGRSSVWGGFHSGDRRRTSIRQAFPPRDPSAIDSFPAGGLPIPSNPADRPNSEQQAADQPYTGGDPPEQTVFDDESFGYANQLAHGKDGSPLFVPHLFTTGQSPYPVNRYGYWADPQTRLVFRALAYDNVNFDEGLRQVRITIKDDASGVASQTISSGQDYVFRTPNRGTGSPGSGECSATVQATDKAGNEATLKVHFFVQGEKLSIESLDEKTHRGQDKP